MSLIRWNPFFMEDPFEDFLGEAKSMMPAMDVYEKDGKVVVESPLPGIDPKNVKVEVRDGILTLSGEEKAESEVDEKNYYRKEVRHGSFHRSVRLPAEVLEDKVEAVFKNGILKITAPKAKEKEVKKAIKIKVEEE
ncbi:MAG: Hsp20/alpha crystallin family protein [Patescibacteria group bacterium]